jgi:hypothetical protein
VTVACGLALGCGPTDTDDVVVTREQLGGEWPLHVNSARVTCSDSGAILRIGHKRYALDDAALAQGLPDAREVAARRPPNGAPADLAPLRAACDGLAHIATGP